MEKLKKARTPLRALATRTCNEVQILLALEDPSHELLIGKYDKLHELWDKIHVIDNDILDLMIDTENPDDYGNEVLANDKYYDDIALTKIKIDRRIKSDEQKAQPYHPPSVSSTADTENQNKKRKYRLPKIELAKFSGKLLDWLSWWSHFEKIHNDEELDDTDKFEYLKQSMADNSRPKEIVNGFPATKENYPKAIQVLKERFGKTKILTQVYVRELFQMGLKNMNKEIDLSSMYDKLVCHIRSLETLGVTSEQAALFLYPMVEASLPEETLIAWQRNALYEKNGLLEETAKNELDYLLQFLQLEVEHEEQRALVKAEYKVQTDQKRQKESTKERKELTIPTAAGLFNGQSKTKVCIFCEKQHDSKDCGGTEFWTNDQMRKQIQEKRACFICLRQNHEAKACKSFVKCHVCSKKHYTIMCPDIKDKKSVKKEEFSDSAAGTNFDCSNDVLLKSIMVFISTKPNMNRKTLARVLFDDGSQRSYIRSSLTKMIQSIPFNHEYMRNVLFDGTKTDCQRINHHLINVSDLDGNEQMTMVLREKPLLGGKISRIPKGFWLDELKKKNIIVNDVIKNDKNTSDIDIVIGSDYWGLIMTGDKEALPCGLTANKSKFGWTLSGVVPNKNQANNSISMFLAEENLQKLWNLEIIGIRDPIEKMTEIQEEAVAKKIFLETVKRNKDGRYQVKLPWKTEEPDICNNKRAAIHRLKSATNKLNKNNQFKTYDDIFNAWIEEGFVEKVVLNEEMKTGCYYLPHHPVFKESMTTPVRPVFDASYKSEGNFSLNDCLYKGPNCIELLPAVLIRFRLKLFGFTSDIRKAFQMIDVEENDREYLRFLWWEDSTQSKIIVLRHLRVVFGLNCSPYLLAAVLEHLLKGHPEKKIAQDLLTSFYVDNCVMSVDSDEEYKEFKRVSTEILREGKMELRQWECSSQENDSDTIETKVLGMIWNKREDVLSIKVPDLINPEKITKRSIASALHKFFDPIGVICPALLKPKIMLQQAWKKKRVMGL